MPVKRGFRVLVMLLLLFPAAGSWPESLRVDYLEGPAEIAAGGEWREAAIGETVPAGVSLRLGPGAVAELAWGAFHFTLIGEGVFYTDSLIASFQTAQAWNLRPLVARKLQALLEGLPERESSAMGARAGEVETDPGFGWVDESEAAVAEAKEMLAAGRHEEALALLRGELALASGEEADTLRYYVAYALAGLGDSPGALAELARIGPDATPAIYGDLVLLESRLLLEAQRFEQALMLLEGYLEAFPGGQAAQEAAYLSAFASYLLGDGAAARARLELAVRLDPDSETGRAAAALHAGLGG